MEIRTFGVGGRMAECKRLLSDRLASEGGRLIILPIPTARDDRYISTTTVEQADISAMLSGSDALVGYGIPPGIMRAAARSGAFVYDAAFDERFLSDNAELTARGCIGYLLTRAGRDLRDLSIGVVGYGRIGSRTVRWLLNFGARVKVFTNRESVAIELGEMGVGAETVGTVCDFSEIDVLINTAPAVQIDEKQLRPDTRIIDLASGRIFEPSDRLTKLPSIPESYFPITAGRLYAEAIIRALEGRGS